MAEFEIHQRQGPANKTTHAPGCQCSACASLNELVKTPEGLSGILGKAKASLLAQAKANSNLYEPKAPPIPEATKVSPPLTKEVTKEEVKNLKEPPEIKEDNTSKSERTSSERKIEAKSQSVSAQTEKGNIKTNVNHTPPIERSAVSAGTPPENFQPEQNPHRVQVTFSRQSTINSPETSLLKPNSISGSRQLDEARVSVDSKIILSTTQDCTKKDCNHEIKRELPMLKQESHLRTEARIDSLDSFPDRRSFLTSAMYTDRRSEKSRHENTSSTENVGAKKAPASSNRNDSSAVKERGSTDDVHGSKAQISQQKIDIVPPRGHRNVSHRILDAEKMANVPKQVFKLSLQTESSPWLLQSIRMAVAIRGRMYNQQIIAKAKETSPGRKTSVPTAKPEPQRRYSLSERTRTLERKVYDRLKQSKPYRRLLNKETEIKLLRVQLRTVREISRTQISNSQRRIVQKEIQNLTARIRSATQLRHSLQRRVLDDFATQVARIHSLQSLASSEEDLSEQTEKSPILRTYGLRRQKYRLALRRTKFREVNQEIRKKKLARLVSNRKNIKVATNQTVPR